MTSTNNLKTQGPSTNTASSFGAKASLWAYRILLYIALPLVLISAWRRCRKVKDPSISPSQCFLARFGLNKPKIPAGGIWIHAVSVGETRSIFPLLELLHKRHPNMPIILTSGSTQGALQALKFCPVPIHHQMIPYDYPFAVSRFLQQTQPKLVLMVETEIWPNLYHACTKNQIPLMLINARLKQRSFNTYQQWAKPLIASTLAHSTLIGAQFEDDRSRFISLGADPQKVKTLGNLKFDIQTDSQLTEKANTWRSQLNEPERFIWVAASTHRDEETLMIRAHQQLLKTQPNALLIIVPRHADRFQEVADLLNSFHTQQGLTWQRRSHSPSAHAPLIANLPDTSTQTYLADTMGELMFWFSVSNVAFIGGSLVNFGGHNILEPAALGKPVLSGPYYQNLSSLYQSFIKDEGLQVCQSVEELGAMLTHFAQNPDSQATWGNQALRALKKQTGSLERHYALLKPYLD